MKKGSVNLTRRDVVGVSFFATGSALLIIGSALESAMLVVLGAITLAALMVLTLHSLGRLRAAIVRLSREAARDRTSVHPLLERLKNGTLTPAHLDKHAQELRGIRLDLETLTTRPTGLTTGVGSPHPGTAGAEPTHTDSPTLTLMDDASHAGILASAAAHSLVTRLLVERLSSVGMAAIAPDEAALVLELWRAVARLKTAGRVHLDSSLDEWLPVVKPEMQAFVPSNGASTVFIIRRRGAGDPPANLSPVFSDEWGEMLFVFQKIDDE